MNEMKPRYGPPLFSLFTALKGSQFYFYSTNRNRRVIHIYNGKSVTKVYSNRPGALSAAYNDWLFNKCRTGRHLAVINEIDGRFLNPTIELKIIQNSTILIPPFSTR